MEYLLRKLHILYDSPNQGIFYLKSIFKIYSLFVLEAERVLETELASSDSHLEGLNRKVGTQSRPATFGAGIQ